MSRFTEVVLVIRNGTIKLTLPNVEQRADGTLWHGENAIIDGEADGGLARDQLTRLVKSRKYSQVPAVYFARHGANPSGLLVLTKSEWEARPEQRAAREAAAQARATEAARLESLFPGLAQLKAALEDEERYQHEFSRMMEDENNDGARPPRPARASSAQLAEQFPAAALYLRAQSLAVSSHWASGRGPIFGRAVERMAAGEDPAAVLADAEREWSEVAQRAVENS